MYRANGRVSCISSTGQYRSESALRIFLAHRTGVTGPLAGGFIVVLSPPLEPRLDWRHLVHPKGALSRGVCEGGTGCGAREFTHAA